MNAYEQIREALEELMHFTCCSCNERYCEDEAEEEDGRRVLAPCGVIVKARDALALPRRNCDVGTAEEQDKRYEEFCAATRCGICPLYRSDIQHCEIEWGQIPYKEKGGDEW